MYATLRLIAVSLPAWIIGHPVILFFSVLLGPLVDSRTRRWRQSPEYLAVPLDGWQFHGHLFPSRYGDDFAVTLGSGSLPICLPVVLPSEDRDSLIRRPVERLAVVVGPHFHAAVVKRYHLLYRQKDRLDLFF